MTKRLQKELAGCVQKWGVAYLVEEQHSKGNTIDFFFEPTWNAIWLTEAEAVKSQTFAIFFALCPTDLADQFIAMEAASVKLAGQDTTAELVRVGIQQSNGKKFRITKFTATKK